MLQLDEPPWQLMSLAHAVLEERPPADGVRGSEFQVGKGEPHQIGYGLFGRTTWVCRPNGPECGIEHHQCSRADAQDQLVEMLEEVVDRSDRAAGFSGEVASLQGCKPLSGDGAFGGIDQLLSQHCAPGPQLRHKLLFERCSTFFLNDAHKCAISSIMNDVHIGSKI